MCRAQVRRLRARQGQGLWNSSATWWHIRWSAGSPPRPEFGAGAGRFYRPIRDKNARTIG
eukprot:scaffold198510_cov51-Attheya_sp.AAC.1